MGSNMAGHCCSPLRPMLDALPPIGMMLLDPDVNEAGLLWWEEARSARSPARSITTLDTESAPLRIVGLPMEVVPEAVAATPPTAPSCCSAATAAVDDSEEEEEEEEECEGPEFGDCGGEEEVLWLLLLLAGEEDFFLSLVRSTVMPGHSKWTQ